MKKILPLFSYILHPIFIPVYATLFYLFSNNSYFLNKEKYLVLLQVVIITVFLPILFFWGLRSTGKISSAMAPLLSERKIPLVLQCFLIIFLVRTNITIERYPELHFFFLGALLSTLIALLLLFAKMKVSLHMIGISALTFFVLGLNLHFQTQNIFSILFLILMNGFIASSRLEMNAHTVKELIIGFLIGALPQVLLMYLWL
ncbi:hypothetical protein AB3G33_05075 [Flavobacterium sp. WC2421]|uniref:Transmembrane protein n=3 Tax=unclassified Flavobacterium TaxID=196869 RepID=A0AB39WES2_9FLAO